MQRGKQAHAKISPLHEQQPDTPAHRNRYPYAYPSNQMLSDILFAASGMGLVILISHSVRLVSASGPPSLTDTVRQQLLHAHQQARAISRQLNLIQPPSLKQRLKQSL